MTQIDSKLPREERGISNRNPIRCLFWLLNVLFLDDFLEDIATLGNVSSRQLLDYGKAGIQQHFWERVSVAYKESDNTFGKLHFLQDEIIPEHSHVDASKIVPMNGTNYRPFGSP